MAYPNLPKTKGQAIAPHLLTVQPEIYWRLLI